MKDSKPIVVVIVIIIGILILKSYNQGSTQAVVGVDCPIFRSNYAAYSSYATPEIWIATDCNGDGSYEAYGHSGYTVASYTSMTGNTPESFPYKCVSDAGGNPINVFVYPYGNTVDAEYFMINHGAATNADLSCGSPPPPTTNMVSNPSFTDGTTGWTFPANTLLSTTNVNTAPNSGLVSSASVGYNQIKHADIAVQPNTEYTFSSYVNIGSNFYAIAGVSWYNSDWSNTGLGMFVEYNEATANQWVQKSSVATSPPNTVWAVVYLGSDGVSDVWFDDISLVEGSTQTCTPYTCGGLGYNCGSHSDGCIGTLNCGTCATGYSCTSGTCTQDTPPVGSCCNPLGDANSDGYVDRNELGIVITNWVGG